LVLNFTGFQEYDGLACTLRTESAKFFDLAVPVFRLAMGKPHAFNAFTRNPNQTH